jgi:hypothetical protein
MYSPSKFKARTRKLAERSDEGVRRAIRSFLPSLGCENAPMLPYDRNPLSLPK